MSHPFQLLAVTGKQCAGKDTFYSFYEKAVKAITGASAGNLKFTDPLYAMQNIIYKLARLEPPKVKDRALLQYLGTDWGRAKDPDIWVKIMRQKVREGYAAADFMVITDMRFPNEAGMVRDMGGKVVKIEAATPTRRARAEAQGIDFIEGHPSETHIDEIDADFAFFNDGTMDTFAGAVSLFVQEHLK